MLNSSLCNYIGLYILIKGTRIVGSTSAGDVDANNTDEKCAILTDYIREINKTQVENAKDIDAVMLMYNLLEQNNNFSETSENLFQ